MNEERLGALDAFSTTLGEKLAGLPGLPAAADLGQLIELAFFASLHEEEARRTELALAWTEGPEDCTAVMALGAPIRATPKSLAKLAPAARRGATSLAVRREGADLVIWALLQHGAAHARPLTVRSLGPGVLRVEHAGAPHALYARGESLFAGAPSDLKSPARRLSSAFASWSSSPIDPRAATVTRLAARTLAHGHGGMILVIPSDASPHRVRMHYEIGQGQELLAGRYQDLLRGVPPNDQLARVAGSAAPDRAQGRFEEAIDLVASLTATDNALLLDTDLRVRGFGVQVLEGEAPLALFEHISPYSDDVHTDDISTFKGTRHPAGVIFCLRQPGEAAAIVASQDGRLSLVVKDARGTVEVLGSYERAFGWR